MRGGRSEEGVSNNKESNPEFKLKKARRKGQILCIVAFGKGWNVRKGFAQRRTKLTKRGNEVKTWRSVRSDDLRPRSGMIMIMIGMILALRSQDLRP